MHFKVHINKKNFVLASGIFMAFMVVYMDALKMFLFKKNILYYMFLFFIFGVFIFSFITNKQKGLSMITIALSIFVLFVLLYNNGDLKAYSYEYIIYLLIGTAMSLVAYRNKNFSKFTIYIIIFFTLVQVFFGFIFLLKPQILIDNINRLFSLDDYYKVKLLVMINDGYMTGLTTHYSHSGIYMATGTLAAVSIIFYQLKRDNKIIKRWLIITLIFFIALLLTSKKAHIFFTLLTIGLVYFLGFAKGGLINRIKALLTIIVIAAVLIYLLMRIPAFVTTINRFALALATSNIDDLTTNRVSTLWEPALDIFRQNWITGIGWREFKVMYLQSQSGTLVSNDVHNVYLQLLCENGLFFGGVIISFFYIMYISCFQVLIKLKDKGITDDFLYLLFSVLYQTFFLLYCFTGNPLYDVQCVISYIASCAIGANYINLTKKRIRLNFSQR